MPKPLPADPDIGNGEPAQEKAATTRWEKARKVYLAFQALWQWVRERVGLRQPRSPITSFRAKETSLSSGIATTSGLSATLVTTGTGGERGEGAPRL